MDFLCGSRWLWQKAITVKSLIQDASIIINLKYLLPRLTFAFAQSIEARYYTENEDVVGAGAAPTTSEWSTILLPTRVRLRLEVLRYLQFFHQFLTIHTGTASQYLPHILIGNTNMKLHYVSFLLSEISGNTSSWRTGIRLSYIANIMAADDLATPGVKASPVMALSSFPGIFRSKHPQRTSRHFHCIQQYTRPISSQLANYRRIDCLNSPNFEDLSVYTLSWQTVFVPSWPVISSP